MQSMSTLDISIAAYYSHKVRMTRNQSNIFAAYIQLVSEIRNLRPGTIMQ